jgi:BASS family bile acid:Na+ symporter
LDTSWIGIALSCAMFTLMFAMGLVLSTDDFRRVASTPKTTLIGVVMQLAVMPLVGVGLARVLGLSPLMSTGLVIVGACPGGMFSNMFVHLARGNTALSITLTASATMVTLFTLPLWIQYALSLFSTGDVAAIEMPVLDTALRLGLLTVLPVALGMLARHLSPESPRLERWLSLPSVVVIAFGALSEATSRPDLPLEAFLEGVQAAGCFAVAAILVGLALPALLGINARDTVTIAVEMIVKNTLLGIVLASQVMDFESLIPIFAFGLFQTPGGVLMLLGWRLLERRGWFGPRHAPLD